MACHDKFLLNDWFPVATIEQLREGQSQKAVLMEQEITICPATDGTWTVALAGSDAKLPVRERYGVLWTCLGTPAGDIVDIPEARDTKRFLVPGGAIRVRTSGLRVVENFLDMAHFPFVHEGWLGEQPHTEVLPYKVVITEDDEVLATDARFFQPIASPSAKGGIDVDYAYQVYRPYIVGLHKTNPVMEAHMDFIVLFIQPVNEEDCIVHSLLCFFKEGMDEEILRSFQQVIFGQDKPILENQTPKRLPLSPRAETPIRADQMSIVYRRWLQDHAVTYGAIPAT